MYHHNYYLIPKPIQLLNPYDRWRKRAELINLSSKAQKRLECNSKKQKLPDITKESFVGNIERGLLPFLEGKYELFKCPYCSLVKLKGVDPKEIIK